jgi:hypothetical protein
MDEITFESPLERSRSDESIESTSDAVSLPLPDEARTQGIGSTMEKLLAYLERIDPSLHDDMVQQIHCRAKRNWTHYYLHFDGSRSCLPKSFVFLMF